MSRRTVLGALSALPVAPIALQAQTVANPAPFQGRYETRHRGTFGGQQIRYTATVAPTVVNGASIVTISYVREGVRNAGSRPVIFVWAGGPGASSQAHHVRFMGPKRIADADPATGRPAELVDNPEALLDISDIVFIDPVGTGFSRMLPNGNAARLYSVGGDAEVLIAVMQAWQVEHNRAASPVFVEGSSYGTVRGIRIGWELRETRPLAGIFMTANSAMVQETSRHNGVLGPTTDLPTMAMTALHHGKIERAGRTDAQIIEQAWAFAMSDYMSALARLEELGTTDRARIASQLQQFSGIPADQFLRNGLVVPMTEFSRLLLSDSGRRLDDRFDGRSSVATDAPLPPPGGMNPLLLSYLSDFLGVPDARRYATGDTSGNRWDYSGPNNTQSNDWPTMLKETMAAAPRLQVYSANGYYDLISTIGQARYLFSRIPLPKDRWMLRDLVGGHMVYADRAASDTMLRDLRGIIGRYVAG